MKVFERSDKRGWGNRLNIVDENNVVVGFDFDVCCCEDFGYVFLDELPGVGFRGSEIKGIEFNHEEYVFDTSYFEFIDGGEWDEGGGIAFKLVNKSGDEKFLVLYNHHNGYYAHGFEMVVEDKKIHDDVI